MSGDLFTETPASILSHHADADAVDSFLAYRKKHKRAGPFTDRAAKRLAAKLRKINEMGGDASDALDLIAERGWQSIEVSWYFKCKDQENGQQHNRMAGQQRPQGNAGAEQITAAAGIRRTSSENLF